VTPANHVVLIGPMGVGKTTVGGLVAARLGRPLKDSDIDLQALGRNARDIAQRHGVEVLHRAEADHLLGTLTEETPLVIAAAASVVEDDRCVRALQPAMVVWLWAPPEVLVSRLKSGGHRRDLGHDPLVALTALAQRRDPLYRRVADATVDVSRLTPDQTAEAVLSRLESIRTAPSDQVRDADRPDSSGDPRDSTPHREQPA
jgi:shikimate kinase